MSQSINIRHRNIDLEWHGWCYLCKKGEFKPLKMTYNGSIGWWVNRKIFFSYKQLKSYL
jgi:hypothetical protein